MKNADIKIRTIDSDDENLARDFYENLSEETFRSFYRSPKNRKVSEDQWEILKENSFDPEKYLLFGVFHDGEIVGLGMLIRIFPNRNEYEIGLLVADAFQKKGIGEFLLRTMFRYAQKHSTMETFIAHTTFTNIGVKKLLRKFGFVLKKTDEEELVWTCKIWHE